KTAPIGNAGLPACRFLSVRTRFRRVSPLRAENRAAGWVRPSDLPAHGTSFIRWSEQSESVSARLAGRFVSGWCKVAVWRAETGLLSAQDLRERSSCRGTEMFGTSARTVRRFRLAPDAVDINLQDYDEYDDYEEEGELDETQQGRLTCLRRRPLTRRYN
ncbi:MAG: hypothetical protein BJ554DRAFT_576, partial [Olpidium bornovanus]